MSDGFVSSDVDLMSILSPEALAALGELAIDKGAASESAEELVDFVKTHFQKTKIGDKEQIFEMKYGDIEFEVKGVKQNLGQMLDSTGLTIWRAAEHLCEFFTKHPSILKGRHVVELGGGLGMVSILIHKMAVADSVVCTDGDDVSIKLLHENAQSTGSAESGMKVEKLYWGEHDEFLKAYPIVDMIVAADVVYEEEQIEPLLTTTVAILRQAADSEFRNPENVPQMILAYARRNVPIDKVFECADRLGLAYEMLDGETEPIVLFTLTKTAKGKGKGKDKTPVTVFIK